MRMEQVFGNALQALCTSGENMNLLLCSNAVRRELAHSDILAMLLSPEYPGALERLNAFLGLEMLKAPPCGSRSWTVRRESRSIDILIEYQATDGERISLILENKVDAGDQDRQIERYVETVKEDRPQDTIVIGYLTPFGHSPSDQSAGIYKKDVRCISYVKGIQKWLETSAEHDESTPRVKECLDSYREFVGEMMKEERARKAIREWFCQNGSTEAKFGDIKLVARIFEDGFLNRGVGLFLQELQAKLIEMKAFSKKDLVEPAIDGNLIDSDEIGFSVKIEPGLAWGAYFCKEGRGFLYTGLFPVIGWDERLASATKQCDKKKRQQEDPWYLWKETKVAWRSADFLVEDGEIQGWVESHWKTFAEDFADYQKLVAEVTTNKLI